MSNVLKTGMDTLEIRDLLGEPYTRDRLAEPGDSDVLFFIYKLGVYREMESSYMDIKFEGNKLKEFHIADRQAQQVIQAETRNNGFKISAP